MNVSIPDEGAGPKGIIIPSTSAAIVISPLPDADQLAAAATLNAPSQAPVQLLSPVLESTMSVPEILSPSVLQPETAQLPTRMLSINDREGNAKNLFPTNVIQTSKYTALTFIPINLFEQFRRVANFYFLIVILLSLIPNLTPYPWYTTALPLAFILLISAGKDGYEDYTRHREDAVANRRKFKRIPEVKGPEPFTEIASGDISVGDLIRVLEGQEFPADLVVLHTSKHDNTCYVNTANLDGEVTPKLRLGVPLGEADINNPTKYFETIRGAVVETGNCSKQLDGFEGTLTLSSGGKIPLGDRQVLLRGAKLSGTEFVDACVIATGPETKLMLNRNPIRYKFSSFERILNKCVLVSLALELALCLTMTVGAGLFNEAYAGRPFRDTIQDLALLFTTSFVLYSFLIPVSLFVTIDFVKIGQAMVIESDKEMSIEGPEGDRGTRQFAVVKSSNLNDELGHVEYLFTDKTGTLTRNKMELSSISTGGIIIVNKLLKHANTPVQSPKSQGHAEYQQDQPPGIVVESRMSDKFEHGTLRNLIEWAFKHYSNHHSIDDAEVHPRKFSNRPLEQRALDTEQFFIREMKSSGVKVAQDMLFCMLICNGVMLENNGSEENPRIKYISPSPDEIALVESLAVNGMALLSAGPSQPFIAKVECAPDIMFKFHIRAQLEFSSDRRRMTIVAEMPDSSLMVFTKGASSTIMAFLAQDSANLALLATTETHLTKFAKNGSRTLMMASKSIDHHQFKVFQEEYNNASVQLQGREKAIERAFSVIEKDLRLLGATSVEDQLQEHVADTIEQLLHAGVHIMMLTGDMQETAVTIGRSSRIIDKSSRLLIIKAENPRQCKYLMDRYLVKAKIEKSKNRNLAMVLNGNSLEMAIQHHPELFLQLFSLCQTVICNRATPAQKAFAVALVKSSLPGICLAIGDGANDVSMIRMAHVGVGLVGREGRQAAQSADFVLHRFAHLRRLIFLHGRYSYLRASKVVLFSFYKNALYPLPLFWFSFFSEFSGQAIYDGLIMTNFNMFFSSWPPLIAGVFEKDALEICLLKHPLAFRKFQQEDRFSVQSFISWLSLGALQSVIIYVTAHALWVASEGALVGGDGLVLDMFTFGTWIGSACILIVNVTFLVQTINLTKAAIVASSIGIVAYLTFLLSYGEFPEFGRDMYGNNRFLFGTPVSYLFQIIVLLLSFLPIVIFNHFSQIYRPNYAATLRQHCHSNLDGAPGNVDCCLTDHEPLAPPVDETSDTDQKRQSRGRANSNSSSKKVSFNAELAALDPPEVPIRPPAST